MSEHPLQAFVQTAMEQLKEMVNVNTTIGQPVSAPDGTLIIPVCKVSYGFAAGGNNLSESFGGGTGGGVSVTPLAFLIIGKTGVQTVCLGDSSNIYNKMLDMAPHLLDKLQSLINHYQSGSTNIQ
ncbi:GerW family sporulation protein [Paenibacillus piri]|uniref:Sporulation protein YtfJ n=1 Tax=Paenibacillus piri TaxID=2547395 RepID=A0A4V2ZSF8_9BACL|nr:GerW family sporulation protein [Paenibacillus piri]TDF93034.1 sporulation protein YtfJ [Paenibacillus piri]